MSEIRGRMLFTDGQLVHIEFNRNESQHLKAIVRLTAEMTPAHEAAMNLVGVFKENGNPVDGDEDRSPKHVLSKAELSLPAGSGEGHRVFFPEAIKSFKIGVADGEAVISFTAHIAGDAEAMDLMEIRKRFLSKSDRFEFSVRAAQGEMFDWTGDAGGTRAEVGATPADRAMGGLFQDQSALYPGQGCDLCDDGRPKNEDGKHMTVDGVLRSCDVTFGRIPDGPALIDAREMGQRREKRQRTRAQMAEASDAELQESVEVIQ